MTRASGKPRRRSIRLRGYDYSRPGAYFVTICTQSYIYLFGRIVAEKMVLNDAGRMAQGVWDELPVHYPGIETDAFIIMPNHIHGIVVIQPSAVGAGPRACPGGEARSSDAGPSSPAAESPHLGQPQGVAPTKTMSLPDVVHRFKTLTTSRYTDAVRHNGWKPFPGRLWQRNYWEHVVRSEQELHRVREYIVNNPAKWESDRLYGPPSEASSEYAEEGWVV